MLAAGLSYNFLVSLKMLANSRMWIIYHHPLEQLPAFELTLTQLEVC